MFYMAIMKNRNERKCSYTWKGLKEYLERHEITYVMNSFGYVRFTVHTSEERMRIEKLLKQFDRNIYVITTQKLFGNSPVMTFD